jgi:hypothetical protein
MGHSLMYARNCAVLVDLQSGMFAAANALIDELSEKAADLWGKAGQRSLARSAVVEAVGHLTRALDQIATLAPTPALRRQQISLQVALANALMRSPGGCSQR